MPLRVFENILWEKSEHERCLKNLIIITIIGMESDYYAPQTISSKKLLLFYRFFADFVIQMLQLRYFFVRLYIEREGKATFKTIVRDYKREIL
jgi:hypothetical protein